MNNIKLVIFDVDGVLLSTKKLHEIAFINALKEFGINMTIEEHKQNYDGLPTKVKLDILNVKEEDRQSIFDLKQKFTFSSADGYVNRNDEVVSVFRYLYDNY